MIDSRSHATPPRRGTRVRLARWSLACVCLVALGCRPADEITTYVVPKEVRVPTATSRPLAEPTHRMLVAIVPEGNQAWFFKVVGPVASVDSQTDEIAAFLSTIRLADDGKPTWQLPDGWTDAGPSMMRAATFTIPTDGEPLEMSVTALPWDSSNPSTLLSNVNRWRGQMGLPPTGMPGLAATTREMSLGDRAATLVDLRGGWQDSGMTAPFAGGGVQPNNPTDESPALPSGHPPIGSMGSDVIGFHSSNDTASDAPQFTAPADWQELPASGIRKAAYQVTDGDRAANVTVIDFPVSAGPAIGDPLANVNRWRSEVGLPPIEEDALGEVTEEIEVGGQPGLLVECLPDPAADGQQLAESGTRAVMVTHGERIWFLKMIGDRELVADQGEAFRSFVESAEFPE